MIADIFTIIWKEWKEIFLQRGSLRSGLLNLGIIVAMVGVFFPLQIGPRWLTDPTGLVTWSWLPLFLVMGVVADAFAGERERHTLETLLASRLPDRAILLGKIGAAVLYGWSITLVSVLVGAVTVNVANAKNGFHFYPVNLFFAILVLTLLATILMSSIGVLVSLVSSTTRQAYQRMSLTFMALWFIPVILLQFLPASVTQGLFQALSRINGPLALTVALAVLVIADIVLIAVAMGRFKRSRLILD